LGAKYYSPSCPAAPLSEACESAVYIQMALSLKPFGIGHVHIKFFLLRMTDTMTSQNIDLSSWDTLCIYIYIYMGYVVAQLRHCAKSQKVAGSILDGVIVTFH
jgi:hypothetical protein